jgi:putative ABC transport system permease protein
VVGEVALAMVLVVGAGLMTRSFLRLLEVDPGFRADHLIAVNFTISSERHARYAQFYRDVIERVRALPGVLAAGAVKDAPFKGNGERNGFRLPGMSLRPDEEGPVATVMHVSDGYFHAIGARIVEGREFSGDDGPDRPFVLVVNQALVRAYLGGGSAVGRSLVLGRDRAIWSLDKDQTITSIFSFDELMNEAVARPRLLTALLGLFGVLGLGLGALGIYGVLAYLVSQRRREIGVRMALGARPGDVLRLVVGRAALLALGGAAMGLVGALVLTRYMQGVLYGVAPTDPLTLASVTAVLLLVAAVATWAPARSAARVDPALALRDE